MNKQYKDVLKQLTILFVEDDEIQQKIFQKNIKSYAKDVLIASNGNEALEIYHKHNPDIIFSDMKMPLMDGLMFINIIRQLNKKIPIVVISAYSDPDTLVDLVSLKLEKYLVKPIDFNQLIGILEMCVREILEKGLWEFKLTPECKYTYSNRSLVKNDEIISLTSNEIALLEHLIKNESKLVTKEQIEHIVYNDEIVTDNAIKTLISKLRRKIGENIIKSTNTLGYTLKKKQ